MFEKSRVVSGLPQEQNFHVFYYLLSGLSTSQIQSYCLSRTKLYRYVCINVLDLLNCPAKSVIVICMSIFLCIVL